jgi:hypothetical protein
MVMPIFGIGLHVIFAIFFAVHAVRTRQQMYWLFILFAFPGLGSLVYFFAIFLPNSRLERGAMQVVSKAAKVINPLGEVRDAREAFDHAPTAQNQMRLAAALLEAGDAEGAAGEYLKCLNGPFASDPDIRFGAARALIESKRFAEGLLQLDSLRRERPNFRLEAISLLFARAHAGSGNDSAARAEFEHALSAHGSFEVQAEYAIWSWSRGDLETGARLDAELQKTMSRWTSATRSLNADIIRRLNAARPK